MLQKHLQRIFDLLVLKKFKKSFEDYTKRVFNYNSINPQYHQQVLDLILQRLNIWVGVIQPKLLILPKEITDTFYKKPQNVAADSLLELVKKLKLFNTQDRMEMWEVLKKDTEVLEDVLLTVGGGVDKAQLTTSSSSNGSRIRFEDEIELYKDNDLLQGFCIDTTSPDLAVLAIATTKGIREIDLKQIHDGYGNDLDLDQFQHIGGTSDAFMSPTQSSRKLRISSKSVSSLNFKNKSNVFKSAFSSLNLSSKQVDHNIIVQCLESHPTSSYYLSGGIDGSVCLWQFGIPEALAAYQLPTKPRIVRCRFNQSGSKFGACDMAGNLMLWQFAAEEDTLKPFYTLKAHSKQTLDFTFLNSGSLLATAGISTDSKKDVCLWDVLLPPHKSLIASYTDQENGASSIVYSPKRQAIIVGGKKGNLSLYDIRTNKTIESFKGHSLNTKSLALDPFEEFVASGSSDGSIKVWSLPSLTCLSTFEEMHKKQTFVRPTGVFKSPVSTYGVMQVSLENNHIFSCGSDGRILKRKYYYKK
eukprot:gene8618-10608_t